ncbi:MAG: hypothetical protein IIY33_05230 [Erysipelotrichaceae bacterium]|nr:hypothetical protein [Erysipelotrichaceae bacterium]MBQ1521441.1 hypothetical protein [Erysipelotrichaceae bacterium]
MLLSIISVAVNVAYYLIMNLEIYTDRGMMPNGQVREWKRSRISRLNMSGRTWLLYVQLFFAVICIITSLLIIFGVKNMVIRKIQLISMIASTVMFAVIMFVSGNTFVNYA